MVLTLLHERFAEGTKVGPYAEIADGLIGIAIDQATRGYVAVVDPALVDVLELDRELRAVARAEHERKPSVREVNIRAQAGCYSSAEVIEALTIVGEVATAKDASGVFSWHPRAADSRVAVDANAVGEAELSRRLGDRVAFDE